MSQVKMQKRLKLKDMTAKELVTTYQYAVRASWAEKIRNHGPNNPAHSSFYQKELSLKREVLRRLKLLES